MSDLLTEPLSSGTLQSSFQRLYKPQPNRKAELSSFWIENVGSVSTMIELKFLLAGQEKNWIKLLLNSGDKAELIDGASIGIFDTDDIQGKAEVNNQVNFNLFGKTALK